jgi:hypothetical protein
MESVFLLMLRLYLLFFNLINKRNQSQYSFIFNTFRRLTKSTTHSNPELSLSVNHICSTIADISSGQNIMSDLLKR